MNKYKLLTLQLIFCVCAYAQTDTLTVNYNALHLELLGNGGLYSINYELRLSKYFGVRAGFGAWSANDLFGAGKTYMKTFPVLGYILLGKRTSKFEAAAGFLTGSMRFKSSIAANDNRNKAIFDLTGFLGYRYQRPGKRFIFRIGLTPFYALRDDEDAYPDQGLSLSAGLSFGYGF
jgi:hypothetical protein